VGAQFAQGATRFYSRELEQQVARAAFGDGNAKRRDIAYDRQLRRAVDLLKGANSQTALFATAARGK
jgi:hypothetical protein